MSYPLSWEVELLNEKFFETKFYHYFKWDWERSVNLDRPAHYPFTWKYNVDYGEEDGLNSENVGYFWDAEDLLKDLLGICNLEVKHNGEILGVFKVKLKHHKHHAVCTRSRNRQIAYEFYPDAPESLLLDSIKKKKKKYVRAAAYRRITDQELLKMDFVKERDHQVKISILSSITDQEFLKSLVLIDLPKRRMMRIMASEDDGDYGYKINQIDSLAYKNIKDNEVLREILFWISQYISVNKGKIVYTMITDWESRMYRLIRRMEYSKNKDIFKQVFDQTTLKLRVGDQTTLKFTRDHIILQVLGVKTFSSLEYDISQGSDLFRLVNKELVEDKDAQYFLKKYVTSDSDLAKRKVITYYIEDKSFLKELSEDINQPEELQNLARFISRILVRIYDQEFLKSAFEKEQDQQIKLLIVSAITNQEFLKSAFENERDHQIRLSIVSASLDQQFLKSLVLREPPSDSHLKSKFDEINAIAYENLTDNDVFRELLCIFIKASDTDMIKFIIKKMDFKKNVDIFEDVFDRNESIYKIIILTKILGNDVWSIEYAFNKHISQGSDPFRLVDTELLYDKDVQYFIKKFVTSNEHIKFRKAMIYYIKDKSLLKKISEDTGQTEELQELARVIVRINDEKYLKNALKKVQDHHLKILIVSAITDQQYLKSLVLREPPIYPSLKSEFDQINAIAYNNIIDNNVLRDLVTVFIRKEDSDRIRHLLRKMDYKINIDIFRKVFDRNVPRYFNIILTKAIGHAVWSLESEINRHISLGSDPFRLVDRDLVYDKDVQYFLKKYVTSNDDLKYRKAMVYYINDKPFLKKISADMDQPKVLRDLAKVKSSNSMV